jgi:hypothetical protein
MAPSTIIEAMLVASLYMTPYWCHFVMSSSLGVTAPMRKRWAASYGSPGPRM